MEYMILQVVWASLGLPLTTIKMSLWSTFFSFNLKTPFSKSAEHQLWLLSVRGMYIQQKLKSMLLPLIFRATNSPAWISISGRSCWIPFLFAVKTPLELEFLCSTFPVWSVNAKFCLSPSRIKLHQVHLISWIISEFTSPKREKASESALLQNYLHQSKTSLGRWFFLFFRGSGCSRVKFLLVRFFLKIKWLTIGLVPVNSCDKISSLSWNVPNKNTYGKDTYRKTHNWGAGQL